MADTPDDRISAALRTINFEVAAIKAAATVRVERAEAELARLREVREDDSEAVSMFIDADLERMRLAAELKEAQAELARLREPAGDVGEIVARLNAPLGLGGPFKADLPKAAELLLRQAGEIEELALQAQAEWDNAHKANDRATSAEALLREAGEHIKAWVSWCNGPAMPHPYDQLKDAKAFLAKLSPAPEPVREDTYPDRVSMEPWPYSGHAPGGSDAK